VPEMVLNVQSNFQYLILHKALYNLKLYFNLFYIKYRGNKLEVNFYKLKFIFWKLYVLPWGQISFWAIFEWPKWLDLNDIFKLNILAFIKPRVRADKRIGPHNYDIISVIIGSMLGDGNGEKHGRGIRFRLQQEQSNIEYLFWFYKFLVERGYCSNIKPKILIRLGKKGKIRYYYTIRTFTFTSFNWIYEIFYINNIKVVPKNINKYLTPLALAIWIIDDGSKVSAGLKIATNSFILQEVEFLCKVLNDKYHIQARPHSAGIPDQYSIYIPKCSINILSKLIKPYMVSSIHYKLNNY
jgi:LAGLIDADG DNA endonuclease family